MKTDQQLIMQRIEELAEAHDCVATYTTSVASNVGRITIQKDMAIVMALSFDFQCGYARFTFYPDRGMGKLERCREIHSSVYYRAGELDDFFANLERLIEEGIARED